MYSYKPGERIQFNQLELMVIEEWTKRGYVQPDPAAAIDGDKVHIGNMVMDLILLTENLGLDFTDCLNVAFKARIGAK